LIELIEYLSKALDTQYKTISWKLQLTIIDVARSVPHFCNPNYSGVREWEDRGSRSDQTKR
jgi:hypothetical protein